MYSFPTSQYGGADANVGRSRIRIVQLLIKETGTYNAQYRRPYQTNLTPGTMRKFQERLEQAPRYTPKIMAGITADLLTPSATPESRIEVPSGWDQPRTRFSMEVEIVNVLGSAQIFRIIGFTDHLGLSATAIDPNMEFYVNSITCIRRTVTAPINGVGNGVAMNVLDTSHILASNSFTNVYTPSPDQSMRPQDIYTMMTRSHYNTNDTLDMRTTVSNQPIKSKLQNGLPTNFVSRILEAGNIAYNTTQVHGDNNDGVYTEARGSAAEGLVSDDAFLLAVANLHNSMPSNRFTYNDLLQIDPNVANDQVTIAAFLSPPERQVTHFAGQTQDWGGSDLHTQLATTINNGVPALMMEVGLTKLAFSCSNSSMGGGVVFQFNGARGFGTGDYIGEMENFRMRFITELMPDITFNNQMLLGLAMAADLVGESRLSITIDNGAPVDYCVPSFCNAMMVPVLTSNHAMALTLANDFKSLVENVVKDCASDTGMEYGII